jgi:hypothetical protein
MYHFLRRDQESVGDNENLNDFGTTVTKRISGCQF